MATETERGYYGTPCPVRGYFLTPDEIDYQAMTEANLERLIADSERDLVGFGHLYDVRRWDEWVLRRAREELYQRKTAEVRR